MPLPHKLCQPLQLTPKPECSWHTLSSDLFHINEHKWLVISDFYSKMLTVQQIPPSQCKLPKVISVLRELFADHGIPESLGSDGGPQFSRTLFVQFSVTWKFKPSHQWVSEAMIKMVKGLLTCAKYSDQDPHVVLL